jgi:hypothetical protein
MENGVSVMITNIIKVSIPVLLNIRNPPLSLSILSVLGDVDEIYES